MAESNTAQGAAGCLNFAVRKAARVLGQCYDEALAPVDLRSTQFSLLSMVSAYGELSINRLAELLVTDRTTLTRNLKPLVKQELVEVGPGTDRRTRVVRLTRAGRHRLARALPLWRQAQERAEAILGDHRSRRLRRDLGVVVEEMQ